MLISAPIKIIRRQKYTHIKAITSVVRPPYIIDKFGEFSTHKEYKYENKIQPAAAKTPPGISFRKLVLFREIMVNTEVNKILKIIGNNKFLLKRIVPKISEIRGM